MKKLLLPLLTAVLLLPNLALGSTLKTGEEVFVNEKINEDLYAAGGLLNVQETVNGDLVAGGGRIYLSSLVSQDLLLGGGDVRISGEVGDDVRVVAGTLEIDTTIKGDLMAAGGDLSLTDRSFVGEDVNLAGGSLIVGGAVNGDVRLIGGSIYLNADVKGNVTLINFDKITFGPKARIQGVLWYQHPEKIVIPDGVVAGEVIFKSIKNDQMEANLPSVIGGISLFSLLATLFFGLFLIWIYRYYVLHVATEAYESTLRSLGVGFLILILTPIAAIIFLVTGIGLPMSLALFALWLVLLYVAKVMAAMLIGFKIVRVDDKSSFGRLFGSFAIGALVYTLIGLVPLVGWVFNLVFVLIALGAYTTYGFEMSGQLRKKKLL